MNKTWSIILIVVACIVVLGGTYWYFGMQKPKTQEVPTPSAVVEPAKTQPPDKASPVVAPTPKTESSLPKQVDKPVPVQSPAGQAVVGSLPAEAPKQMKRMPAPIAPSMTKDGGFALPSLGVKGERAAAGNEASTSVLASEALAAKAEVSTPPTMEETQVILPVIDEPVVQQELPVVASEDPQGIQESKPAEGMSEELAKEEQLPPVTTEPTEKEILEPVMDEPVGVLPEVGQATPAAPTPKTVKILRSETVSAEEMATNDKPALEANLSVSFLDYNFPTDFASPEKGFTISVDVMSQNKMFGWGGTLEVGKNTKTDVVQISLLGKAAWKLGKGVVTYPLSVSLGPTLFIDAANDLTFGMKGKLSAGATYAISESFRMFYAVGVGVTYNFQDSSSFRFVLEPIRVGVGFSF